jgi:hypothetical protein
MPVPLKICVMKKSKRCTERAYITKNNRRHEAHSPVRGLSTYPKRKKEE